LFEHDSGFRVSVAPYSGDLVLVGSRVCPVFLCAAGVSCGFCVNDRALCLGGVVVSRMM